jgi:mannose-1-phosphate guanylyltransferase
MMEKTMNYAVIMAGGCGTRLWPLSRQAKPKQVLNIFGSESLLQKSFNRLCTIFEPEQIFVQTNRQHVAAVSEDLPQLPQENIIAEPFMRNTAAAIALAATFLTSKDPDASMVVVTADHIIEPLTEFEKTIRTGIEFVNNNPDALVTFGITPTHPSTQYGYIHLSKPATDTVFKVGSFREKPDIETATEYIQDGNYYWNSGMFVWKAQKILREVFTSVPGSCEPLSVIAGALGTGGFEQVLEQEFAKVPKISIDYAVMEKSSEVYAVKMGCKWLDMGSYEALADVLQTDNNGNSLSELPSQLMDCKDNIIVSTSKNGHLIAAIGIENLIVAHSDDATFICPREQADKIKQLLEKIEQNDGKYI